MIKDKPQGNNPETIEIHGLKTIHRLCRFASEKEIFEVQWSDVVNAALDEIADLKTKLAKYENSDYVLIKKSELKDCYHWGDAEFYVNSLDEYDSLVEIDYDSIEIFEKWQSTEHKEVYLVKVYIDEDTDEIKEFSDYAEAKKAVEENAILIKAAQGEGHE